MHPKWALIVVLLALGCERAEQTPAPAPPAHRDPELTVLRDAEPLKKLFNADKDKVRVLALVSPT